MGRTVIVHPAGPHRSVLQRTRRVRSGDGLQIPINIDTNVIPIGIQAAVVPGIELDTDRVSESGVPDPQTVAAHDVGRVTDHKDDAIGTGIHVASNPELKRLRER